MEKKWNLVHIIEFQSLIFIIMEYFRSLQQMYILKSNLAEMYENNCKI